MASLTEDASMNSGVGEVSLPATHDELPQIFWRVFWWNYFDLDWMPGTFSRWIRSFETDRIMGSLFFSDGLECKVHTLASSCKKNLSTGDRRQLLKPALVHYKRVVLVGIRLAEEGTDHINK